MRGKTIALIGIATFCAAGIYGLGRKNQALTGVTKGPLYKVQGPLVSVIVPTYREEDYLHPLLTSIANQTYEPLEVIVSDASPPESKEATFDLVNAWQSMLDINMVDSPNKGEFWAAGVALGRNIGAAAANGEILLFIDADCIMEPQYIEKLAIDLDDGAILAHGVDCWYDNDLHNTLKSFAIWLKPRLHTTGRGILIRKEHFDSVGGYLEIYDPLNTSYREDLEFGRRIEDTFGPGSVRLNRNAVVGESLRRPLLSPPKGKAWRERGWRRGTPIHYQLVKPPAR